MTDEEGNVVYSDTRKIILATDTWQYTYDADGLRTKATNGHNTYEYTYDGGKLTSMVVNGEDVFYFFYDGNGKPMLFMYNGIKYFYATNLQGDVTAIVSVGGNEKVEYTYDAWGNILSITGTHAATLGRLNPLRYRGYVYDQPTQLYYLQSRYYSPELGRFINADALVSTGQGLLGNNMFAYCLNNPIIMADSLGTDAIFVVDIDPSRGLAIVGHAYVYIEKSDGKWCKTEFTGQFPYPSTAHIDYDDANMQEVDKMQRGESIKGLFYVYIEGDFSASADAAKACRNTNFGGYCPFTNNCLHYAKAILSRGRFENRLEQMTILISTTCIPIFFYNELANAHILALSMKEVKRYVKNIRNGVTAVAK